MQTVTTNGRNMTPSKMQEQYERIESIQSALKDLENLSDKVAHLNSVCLISDSGLSHFLQTAPLEEQYAIKSLWVLGQEYVVSSHWKKGQKAFAQLISTLKEVEQFYDVLGGIIGYHMTIIRLINESEEGFSPGNVTYKKPIGMDISKRTSAVKKAIRKGIENLGQVAEIYPVGGAGDRLNLCNADEPLPAAQLPFMGMTLLETMIQDLQGREYLHYKLFGKQVQAPIALMTSTEKRNHEHIVSILNKCKWFHRPKEKYFLFTQPMVPVIAITGEWMMVTPGHLMLKPGGHGVLWKLAEEKGVFEWLYSLGCEKALVRQINNPVAGLDYMLLAFAGLGIGHNKTFGFASCNRYVHVSEGMDILTEVKKDSGYDYSISNIEYTEFAKKGVKDIAENPQSPFSIFPANTNILFVNLKTVQSVLPQDPIPGMLINMKTTVCYTDEDGNVKEVRVGRLESTMQNIADRIVDHFPHRINDEDYDKLQSFIVFNERDKTICVTKKSYVPGQPIEETPEGCFYHIQKLFHEFFASFCNMEMPQLASEAVYLKQGPAVLIHLHPGLGPLWSVIAQKINGGTVVSGSELQLSIAELEIKNLHLEGSLLIEAKDPLGLQDNYAYTENCGRCVLNQVTIKNKGIDRQKNNQYWKNEIKRNESLKITLSGNAEFVAESITFEGDLDFDVPAGHRMTVYRSPDGKLERKLKKITKPSWQWTYGFDEEDTIVLRKISS